MTFPIRAIPYTGPSARRPLPLLDKKKGAGETRNRRFVHITNLVLATGRLAPLLSTAGRQRWKIENQGFNTQKNSDYRLKHKYSRTSFTALKNYYQCLQIAHMIHQMLQQDTQVIPLMKGYLRTWHYLLESLRICACMIPLQLATESPPPGATP